jgi:hypothetical protein
MYKLISCPSWYLVDDNFPEVRFGYYPLLAPVKLWSLDHESQQSSDHHNVCFRGLFDWACDFPKRTSFANCWTLVQAEAEPQLSGIWTWYVPFECIISSLTFRDQVSCISGVFARIPHLCNPMINIVFSFVTVLTVASVTLNFVSSALHSNEHTMTRAFR